MGLQHCECGLSSGGCIAHKCRFQLRFQQAISLQYSHTIVTARGIAYERHSQSLASFLMF